MIDELLKKWGEQLYYSVFVSPWGEGAILWDEAGVSELLLPGTGFTIPQQMIKEDIFDAVKQIEYYFDKKLKNFEFPLAITGTSFQMKVWQGLRAIPYGETVSYQELAASIGCPKAARAVGNANHRNPVPIVIPCHRVIKADGSIGGFGAGIELKKGLLALEKE